VWRVQSLRTEPLREDERVAGVRTAYEDGATDEAMISRNGHATMRLMGDWNWWAPKPLARLHKRLGLSEKTIDAPDSAALPPYETTPSTKRR
jgi:hypothetical protein